MKPWKHPVDERHASVPRAAILAVPPVRAAAAIRMLGIGALSLCSCVGPDFHRPAPPAVDRYTQQNLPTNLSGVDGPGGAAQRFLSGETVPRDWWTRFGSADLNALVAQAMRANPNVKAAQAALRQALEIAAAQRSAYFPTVQAGFDPTRQLNAVGVLQPTLNSGTALFNLFTTQVSVSYVPDVFGANRRQVESLTALAEMDRFELDATYLTLTSNVVTAAIEEAGFRAQIAATQRVVALERQTLDVLRGQLDLGAVSGVDVLAQEAALAQAETTLPPLEKQLQQTHDLIATLVGKLPPDLAPLHFELDELQLPQDLPLGVPSELVERRPDVRAAEAQLHAATAQVGVALANMLPQVTITGDIGSTATMMSDLFRSGTGFWTVGASLSQTLFAGGALLHRKRAADAALDQAAETYRAAVLTAFQNVADALHALRADADAMAAASRAVHAADETFAITRRQLVLGSVGYVALLSAEQTDQQAVIALAQARTNRLADTAALFQALGGAVAPPAAAGPATMAPAGSVSGAVATGAGAPP
jgi:NodT family efflux transporter outer membrane factor (OMF) lipoprotein